MFNLYVGEYPHSSHHITGPRKCEVSHLNFVASNYSRSAIRATCVSIITSAILMSGRTRLDFSMVWQCEQQWWLRRSRKLVKWSCIRSHKRKMLLYSRVTKYITFQLKNSSTHLRFWCRQLITGWTTSRISMSFYSHWMTLGMCQSAYKNVVRPVS